MRPKSQFKRVFFIGAGFSAGMHYPVGSELMQRLIGYLNGEPEAEALQLGGFTNSVRNAGEDCRTRASKIVAVIERVLRRYLGVKLQAIDQVAVAEFFTMAHTLSDSPWLLARGHGMTSRSIVNSDETSELTLFRDLAAVTRSYFQDISEVFRPPNDIQSVLSLIRLRPEDNAVINFNWDEEVELALSSGDGDVAYTLGSWHEQRTHTLVLKPHGSIGWYDLQQGIANTGAYLIIADHDVPRYERRIVSYSQNELPMDLDGETPHSPLSCPPVITAPTFAKRFEYVEQHRIWQDVIDVCSAATEFVFLGYSLPRDDFLTRAAIRSSIGSQRRAQSIKCLVLDRGFDDAKLLNFLSVFSGFSLDHNHLKWNFGANSPGLDKSIRSRLRAATLPR